MANPNTFDEASAATQSMFENPADAPPEDDIRNDTENQAEETPPEDESGAVQAETTPQSAEEAPSQSGGEPSAMEQAAQTAEIAAQVASEKDNQLQQAMNELEALKRQNQQLQGAVEELSKKNTVNVIAEALEPPTLDINGLAFADEQTQREAMSKFAESMSEYSRQQLMKEMSPAIEFAKKGMRDAEAKEAVEALSQIPELSDIREMLPQLDRIIQNNKWLQSDDMPVDEKYINAYAMARGINTINNPPAPPEEPKELTAEEMMELYNGNPAFRELVEKQRIEQLKGSQQVPPFSASSGAVNAALNIKEKPQTLEEASKRTREMFGGV